MAPAPCSLPVQPTPLIGREREIHALRALLARDGVRLVTLTGPGGIGKTRLGLQVAAELAREYPDGVFFVGLAPISDPSLVAARIAQALGLADASGRSPLDLLIERLGDCRLLLVLDNFEQVLDAAMVVDDLLRNCSRLSILVTSRAPLHLRSEHEYPAPPLLLPESRCVVAPEALSQYEAVALFIERAVAIRPGFMITDANAPAVAAICARLDGLPLAIELAAARLRVLSPEALLPLLSRSLDLLTGGHRDLPDRQRTLRSAFEWSYDLLSAEEQRLFRRLSVFIGGFTLDAAEDVARGEDRVTSLVARPSTLNLIGSLIDNSLLRQDEFTVGRPRYRMLETIREYALERLAASGESSGLQQRHLMWCLDLVQRAARLADGLSRAEWLNRLETEHDNLRAALRCSLSTSRDPLIGLRLARGLAIGFWPLRGHLREARIWLVRVLARSPARTADRADALERAGFLAIRQNDYPGAMPFLEEALSIWHELGDRKGLATTLRSLGVLAHHQGDYDRAASIFEESLFLLRQLGDVDGVQLSLLYFADLARDHERYAEATSAYEEGRSLAHLRDDTHGVAYALRGLGHIARVRGEYSRACEYLQESLCLLRDLGDRRCTPICLEGLACTEVGPNWAERAIHMLAAAEAFQATTGAPASPGEMADYRRTEADARLALGEERFSAVWASGAAMSLDEAVAYALANDALAVAATRPSTAHSEQTAQAERRTDVPLSAREQEVVSLIAQGRSNREIADALVLSVRTVERHIENVYNRLGITGRAGRAVITAYALRHGLVAIA